jgi:hypothetical protein
MTELKILAGPIFRGDYERLKEELETIPEDANLVFEIEPYCNIQSRPALKTFKLLLDDPRFVFDDLFVARQLYFSSAKSRKLVMNHPKFQTILKGRVHFTEYFYERYKNAPEGTKLGMYQRFYQASRAIRAWKRENFQRLAFHLYPALVHYTQRFKQRYYAPDGNGYFNAKTRFEIALCI